jgi:Zn-dependent peptidase ImmA (M78 family)/transcriptional regulator with XRE-family HTH domain
VARSVPALVKGSLLEWARRSAKMAVKDAAEKLKVDQSTLIEWETGKPKPTLAKLREMAALYRRPLAVFYLPEPPTGFDAIHDFRLVDPERPSITTALEFALREVVARRERAVELALLVGYEPPRFEVRATLNDDADAVAKRIRDRLGVSIDRQLRWRHDSEAVNSWRAALEGAGVLVFRVSELPWEDARGFSISDDVFPAIAFNSQEDIAPRVFTMLHEAAHIALRAGGIGICNLDDDGKGDGPRIEAFCNRVAGAIAVPREALLGERDVHLHRGTTWEEDELRDLARLFRVSNEVIARRLVIVGKASTVFYNARRAAMKERFEGKRVKVEGSKAIELPPDRVLRESGGTFTRLVLSAYGERRITASDVADALAVRVKHLDAIVMQLRGAA